MHSIIESQSFTLPTTDYNLKGAIWKAPQQKAVVCLVHGFGEHIDRYSHVARHFNRKQLSFYAIDLPGHGKTSGKRGDIASLNSYLKTIQILIAKARNENPGIPLFLYGHSMGGGLAARYLVDHTETILKGVLLTSPWIELAVKPNKIQIWLGKLLLKLGIHIPQKVNLEPAHLSRDLEVGKKYIEDPLVHNQITPRTYFALLNNGAYLLNENHQTSIPVLIAHGTDDHITSMNGSKKFAEKLGTNTTLKLWTELRHETQNETNKTEVLDFYTDWILEKI